MEADKTESQTKLVAFRIAPEMAEFIERLAQENFRTLSQELRRIITMEKQRHTNHASAASTYEVQQ